MLLLSLGVAAALVGATFVGAAIATTGAPVFYDARYPQPAPAPPDGYDVSEGVATVEPPSGQIDDADSATPTPDSPDATGSPAPPATTSPTPPASTPTPTPDPDGPVFDERAPGGPDAGADSGPPTPEEQQAWLAFQQIVRECMAEAGHEYLYWEWWNPALDTSNRFPAMPADLGPEQSAAWALALHGDSSSGKDYRWQRAGCWGYAVHVTGGTN
jgi:hypothetical protein